MWSIQIFKKQFSRERKSVTHVIHCHFVYFKLFCNAVNVGIEWFRIWFGEKRQRHGQASAGPLSCTDAVVSVHRSTRMTRPVPLWHGSTPQRIISTATATFDQISRVPHPVKCPLFRPPFAFGHLSQSPRSHFVSWLSAPLSTFPPRPSTVSSLRPLLPCSDVFATLGSSLCWICHLSLFFTSLNKMFLSYLVLILWLPGYK